MRSRRLAAGAAVLIAAVGAPPVNAGESCQPWRERVLASDLGQLEKLEFDGRGGLLLSAGTRRAMLRLVPSGEVTTLVPDVDAPGGQRVRGNTLFFNTGDSAQ